MRPSFVIFPRNCVCRALTPKIYNLLSNPYNAPKTPQNAPFRTEMPVLILQGVMATTTINGIPVYRATLSSDKCGMKKISLVDAPAVEADFLAFAKETAMRYAVQDEERHLVRGVIMRADFPIYRYSRETGEYYIMYDAATIREMAEKYLVEGRQNNVNLQHEEGTDVDGVNLVQFFLKDTAAGVSPAGFEDIEDGSLFGEFHIENEDVWAGIKDGTYKGFSLEGIFGAEAVHEVISTEKMAINQQKTILMKIMDIVRGAIATALENAEGSEEFRALTETPAPEAKPDETKPATFGSVATDKGILHWDGSEALKVGDPVRMVAEDGAESEAVDGIYATESHTIEVAGGAVRAITEAEVKAAEEEKKPEGEEKPAEGEIKAEGSEPDPAPVAEEKKEEAEQKNEAAEMVARLAQSFDDKYRAIYKALAEAGVDASYIVEAGDTFAVVEIYADGYKYFRYSLSFNEDGSVVLGESVEVFPAFATAEEKAEIESKYAAIETELGEVKAELAAVKKAPVTKTAHERYNSLDGKAPKTGDEKMNAVTSVLDAK